MEPGESHHYQVIIRASENDDGSFEWGSHEWYRVHKVPINERPGFCVEVPILREKVTQ